MFRFFLIFVELLKVDTFKVVQRGYAVKSCKWKYDGFWFFCLFVILSTHLTYPCWFTSDVYETCVCLNTNSHKRFSLLTIRTHCGQNYLCLPAHIRKRLFTVGIGHYNINMFVTFWIFKVHFLHFYEFFFRSTSKSDLETIKCFIITQVTYILEQYLTTTSSCALYNNILFSICS